MHLFSIFDAHIEFTKQELLIIKLSREFISNQEIANHLNISEVTVKCHRRNIMRKAGIKGKKEMTRFLFSI